VNSIKRTTPMEPPTFEWMLMYIFREPRTETDAMEFFGPEDHGHAKQWIATMLVDGRLVRRGDKLVASHSGTTKETK
jgi:hypothetical protein